MTSQPLDNYSSLHQFSLLKLMGLNLNWPAMPINLQYSCNMHAQLNMHPEAHFILHTQAANLPPSSPSCSVSINRLTRWQLDISACHSLEEHFQQAAREQRRNYNKSKKNFASYGCRTTVIEGPWLNYVEPVYQLYAKVANRYARRLYNEQFFRTAAVRPDFKLLCAWYKDEMIAVFVLQEEQSTLHSICCGLDYHHSSASYAYSWMHYALLDYAIQSGKYHIVDVGVASDAAKKSIGFQPVSVRMDLYCKSRLLQNCLQFFSRFFNASISKEQKLKIQWRQSLQGSK